MTLRAVTAMGMSLAAHALAFFGIFWMNPGLALDVEFTLPESVEFGLADAVETFTPAAADAPEPPQNVVPEGLDVGPVPPEPDPETARREALAERARRERLRQLRRARRAARHLAREQREAGATIPAGAQLALRINLASVRGTNLEERLRAFLAQVPDWQLVLEGSGIDPVRDLDRIMIASPNLRRSRAVIAGRHTHDVDFAAGAVAALAAARGEPAAWSALGAYPIAPWKNQDRTERVIALLGPQSFLIAREEDVPRVLATALAGPQRQAPSPNLPEDDGADQPARQRRDPGTVQPETEATTSLIEALLWMPEGAILSFAVEGAGNYARGPHVPERASLIVRLRPDQNLAVEALLRFASEEEADAAAPALQRLLQQAQQNLWLAMTGMSTLVSHVSIEQSEASIRATTRATPRQAQVLLALVGARLNEYARTRGDFPNPNAQNPNAQNPNAQNPNAQNPNAQNPNAQNPNAQNPNAPSTVHGADGLTQP